jgi:hypothetical protein
VHDKQCFNLWLVSDSYLGSVYPKRIDVTSGSKAAVMFLAISETKTGNLMARKQYR